MNLEPLYYEVISSDRKFYHVPMYLVLRCVSVFYAMVLRVRAWCYSSGLFRVRRLNCRVISVGNLTLGGTGKTPMVMRIAEILRENGYKPAILSRGYAGESSREVDVVSDGTRLLLSAREAGDEPVMMAQHLENVPVLIGRSRYQSGKHALENFDVDTLILDDGFQHMALHRDLNILLCDARKPFGNGSVFPAGELREPPEGLARADVVCLTRVPEGENAALLPVNSTPSLVIKSAMRPSRLVRLGTGEEKDLSQVRDRPVAAFCGIAQPEDFLATLRRLHANVVTQMIFPDHYPYSEETVRRLESNAREAGAECLLTTEKDGIKLKADAFSMPVYCVRVRLEFLEGEDALLRLLMAGDRRGTAAP